MSFDLVDVEAQLDLLQWRDAQMEAITDQLEAAFPELTNAVEAKVLGLSLMEVGKAQMNPKPLAESLITPWAEEQSRIALRRAEDSLQEVVANLQDQTALGDHFQAALPALAGVGVIAASVVGLPAVVSFATVSTSVLGVTIASSISAPLLLAGGVVLTGLSVGGVKTLGYAKDKARSHLVQRVIKMALPAVFGYGLAPDARCLINDLQAIVLKAGKSKLSESI